MDKILSRLKRIGKTRFVLAMAVFLGISMSLFSTLVNMIVENHFALERFYSASALGMFTGGFIGGLFIGVGLWYIIENRRNKKRLF